MSSVSEGLRQRQAVRTVTHTVFLTDMYALSHTLHTHTHTHPPTPTLLSCYIIESYNCHIIPELVADVCWSLMEADRQTEGYQCSIMLIFCKFNAVPGE